MSKKSPRQRRVHFRESNNIVYRDNVRVRDECDQTWYKDTDYCQFRNEIRGILTSKDSKSLQAFKEVVAELFAATQKVDYELKHATKALSADQKKQLKKLYKSSTKYLGLEYEVVDAITNDIMQQRAELQQVVRDIQREVHEGLWRKKDVRVEFRDSCVAVTQAPTLFAQLLAVALAKQTCKQA
eukprot:CAMPEP_0168780320 /NCGR_PEP_ID=MMETSP0725-20121227/8060_1 /TAXON_ID=265536 /ORGANISM="Amphiprora sp., Strain CCMP467" /LENGTH=183 /DNA_ID=CAMNT_0008830163 /DNA_START=173 /DNA_END=724 /DNA_ORIENTATION=+